MQRFIALENIKRYKRILAETDDERKQETVRRLLAEEEARLRELMATEPGREKIAPPIALNSRSTDAPTA
jgi:hypothetical protein